MSDLYLINFKSLQDVVNISVDHRPINIYNLMKHGFKHYIKVSDITLLLQSLSTSLEAKQTGKISKERPSKDYLYYLAYNEDKLLTLYNAENNTPIEAYKLLSLLDVAFYQYDQDKEDLLTFVKKQINGNIETSLNIFSDTLNKNREEDLKALKPYLKKLNTLLEQANEETIDTFIIFSNSIILIEVFYLRGTIQEKPLSLREFLEYFINNLEATLKQETLLQLSLRKKLADFLISLNLKEEELIEEFNNPAQELIKNLYSNIASEKDSGQAELERLTTLENAKKLEGKDYFIFNYFKYNSVIMQNNIAESNLKEARELLKDIESGKLASVINLYNLIFDLDNKEELALITKNDIFLKTANNIVHGLLTLARIDKEKVISSTDLELYLKIDQLSEQEKEELNARLRRSDKEFINHIINYLNIKKAYDLKEIELNNAKKELKQAKSEGLFGEELSYLAEKIENLKAELKEIGERIKPASKNVMFYNGVYYKNKATVGKDTYINEEKSGKLEITNEDNSISLMIEEETGIKQSNLTFDILLLVFEIVGRTQKNKVFFSLKDIYEYMQGKGELQPNDTTANKEQAVIKFYKNCYLLQGLFIEHCILKRKGFKKEYKNIGKEAVFTRANYKQYEGVYITLNEELFNINNQNNGFVILPHEIRSLNANTTLMLYGLREHNRLSNSDYIRADKLAQFVGLGDTHYKGKNKSRVVEGLNKIITYAEEIEKAIRLKSPLPTTLNDNLLIEDLLQHEDYKKALANSRKKDKSKAKTTKKR